MKKSVLILALAATVAGGVFAQRAAAGEASTAKNWVSGELSILGVGARYERVMNPKLTVGANAYFSTLIVFSDIDLGGSVRYYPWGGKFFVEGALGFHIHNVFLLLGNVAITGAAITPGVGWKIDVGNKGGFFIQPGIRVPITLGVVKLGGLAAGYNDAEDGDFTADWGIVPYFGMGWAF